MENSLKGLILAAGTIITCIIISLGFYIAREARDTAANGAGQISRLNTEFQESNKSIYDGLEISGSEIINVINKFKKDNISIKVETKKSITYYINKLNEETMMLEEKVQENLINNAQKITSNNYINPNAQFLGKVIRDSNDAIIGIHFKQE